MLADISRVDAICIVCGRTDMRKQIDGLCAIIEEKLHMGKDDNALFLFCGRSQAILYEGDGIVLLYKRLSVDGRFRWPKDQAEVRQLTWQQFDWLMSGLEIEQPKAFRPLPAGGKSPVPSAGNGS